MLAAQYPLENGIVRNWEDIEHVWDYTFNEKLVRRASPPAPARLLTRARFVVSCVVVQRIDPSQCKLLLTEPPMNPKANREKLVQIMFEKYGFQAVYVAIQAVLTLYAQGNCCCNLLRFARPTHALDETAYAHRSLDWCRRRQWRWRDAHCACLYVQFVRSLQSLD